MHPQEALSRIAPGCTPPGCFWGGSAPRHLINSLTRFSDFYIRSHFLRKQQPICRVRHSPPGRQCFSRDILSKIKFYIVRKKKKKEKLEKI